jgi:hypothetical protein
MTVMIEGPLIKEIRKGWHGNGGKYSLHQLTRRHNLQTNEVYCVLAIPKQSAKSKEKNGWKVHAFTESYRDPAAT